MDSYVFDNENLSQEQFKNKVHQNATRANDVLTKNLPIVYLEDIKIN